MASDLINSITHFKTYYIFFLKNRSIIPQSPQTRHDCYKRDMLPVIASQAQSLNNYFKIISSINS
jgi:hypothetical protein